MSVLNHEYGIEAEKKVADKAKKFFSACVYTIKQSDNGYQKGITITYSRKQWNKLFIPAILIFVYIFLIINYNLFLLIITLSFLFLGMSGQYSKRIRIAKDLSDNTTTIYEQAILKRKSIIYTKEEDPKLRILKISYIDDPDRFALALVSNNKMTLLHFVTPPYLRVGSRVPLSEYQDILMLSSKEIQDIATFLSLQILDEPRDLVMVLRSMGVWNY